MRILFVDDNPSDFELARLALKEIPNLIFDYVEDFTNFKLTYLPNKYSAIISDYNLCGIFGTEILNYVRAQEYEVPFIIVSGAIGEQRAVDLLRQGATDYVLKDNLAKLPLVLLRSLKEAELIKVEKLTFKQLKESEIKFRTLFNQAGVGVAQTETATGNFIKVNKKYCSLLGYQEEELLKLDFLKISHPEDLKEDLDNMNKLRRGEIVEFSMEKRLFAKDGSIIWVKLTVSPMWAPNEKPDFHIAIIENITDKKNAELALKKSEEEYRALIENMNDAIVLVDLFGTIIYVNKKFSSISGYTKEEAIGKNVVKLLLNPEIKKGFEEKMAQRKRGESELYEIEFFKKDGEKLIVNVNASPIYSKGEVVGSMTILSNITEHKKKEKLQRILYAIANYTNKRVTVTSLCEFVHFEISKIIEAESFFVNLYEAENNLLKFPYSADNPDNVVIIRKDFDRPYNYGLSEHIIETKKTLLFNKKEMEDFLKENPKIKPNGKNALSWMAAPLLVNGIVLGVIGVQSYIKDNIYSQKDLEILSFISEQLATGIQKIQTQNYLIKSEEKFRKIFETITDVYYQADMKGLITLISPSSLSVLGYAPKDLIGKPITDFYENPDSRVKFIELLLKNGKIENYETCLVGYSKEKIYVSANISLRYNDQRKPIGIQGILHNITEKKKHEVELIKREKLLREAQQIAKLGSWEWNIQTNMISLSEEMYAILEIDPKNFDNKLDSLKTIIHPDSSNRFSEVLYNAVNNFRSVDVELKIVTKNENEKILLLRASSQIESKNSETIIHGTVLDITELKKSIDLVVKSESKFRKIFESITDVYYQADMNGKILSVSPSCLQLTGYRPEELIGVFITALFDNPKAKKIILKKIIEKININNLETKLISKSGKLIYISANINLIVDANNKPIGTQGIIRNISENKKHEEQLKSSLKLNQGIINATDQMFYVVKIENEKIGSNPFTYVSPQSQLYYGLTPNELIADPSVWFDRIHPDDAASVVEQSKGLFKKREALTRIYRIRKIDTDEDIWVEDYVYPVLNEFGEIQELYGSINNITPLKNKEVELEKLIKELTNKYNELTQFNYIVSHNLRSPIASILGLSNLFDSNLLSEPEKDKAFGQIRDQILKMDDLIKDLNLVLATRSALNTKRQKIDLTIIINSITDTLENQIKETNCVINVNVSDDARQFYTIKSYLESIILNLVSNAIKYKSSNRDPEISIIAKKDFDNINITIFDNGSGIDMEVHGKYVFGLYRRFHTDQEGKGLGLHMTKTQVEALGGKISIESKPNVGTKFIITIPINFNNI